MRTVHRLKTIDRYFDAIVSGAKTFEVRKNDRAFQTGDILELIMVNERGRPYPMEGQIYGEITIRKRVTYLLQGGQFGIEPQYCVMGLGDAEEEK